MTISSSYDFDLTVGSIISAALRKIRVLSRGESLKAYQSSDGRQALNLLVKAWQGEGIGVWLNQELTLYQSYEGYSYNLGPTGDHASPSGYKTELSADAASGATTFDLDSVSGMSAGYNIGIELDSGQMQWTMVDSISTLTVTPATALSGATSENNHVYYYPGASTELTSAAANLDVEIEVDDTEFMKVGNPVGLVKDDTTIVWTTITSISGKTIGFATVDGAAAVGNTVYIGGPVIGRPLEILEARRRAADGNDTPLCIIGMDEYIGLNDKTSTGTVNQIYLDPQHGNAKLYTWPACGDVKERIMMTTRRMISDFDSVANTGELPPECLRSLVYNLALELAPEYKKEPDMQVRSIAIDSKRILKGMNKDKTSVYFGPSRR